MKHSMYGMAQSTTYSDCGTILANTALQEDHAEVAVASKCRTDKTEDQRKHLELNANHWQLHAHKYMNKTHANT